MVGLTLAGMTTIATAAGCPEDRDCRPSESSKGTDTVYVGVTAWGADESVSSIDQAIRYTDEQIDTLNRLSAALLEKLGPILAHDDAQEGPGEPSTRDRLTPLVRSQHAVSIAELGDRLAYLVDFLRDALGRVDL